MMKKPTARVHHYGKVAKPAVTCFCCTETFAGNQLLDAHLQRQHPYWFQDTLKKIYLQRTTESVDVVQELPQGLQAAADSFAKLA